MLDTLAVLAKDFIEARGGLASRIRDRIEFVAGTKELFFDFRGEEGEKTILQAQEPPLEQIINVEPSKIVPSWYLELFKRVELKEHKIGEEKQKQLIREAVRKAIRRAKWN